MNNSAWNSPPDGVKVTRIAEAPHREMDLGRGITRLLAGPNDELTSVDLHINELTPGGGLGNYHVHKHADNVYVVLEGVMEAVIAGIRYILPEDSVVVVPAGVPHAAGNGGSGIARLFEARAPAGPDFHVVPDPDSVVDAVTGQPVDGLFDRT